MTTLSPLLGMLAAALAALGLVGAGCEADGTMQSAPQVDPEASSRPVAAVGAQTASVAPIPGPATSGRTTSGRIALANLDGQIASARRLFERSGDETHRVTEAELRLRRARIVGQRSDVDEARALIEAALEADPSPEARRVYAAVLAYDHRFTEALELLESIDGNGATAAAAEIRYALGEVDGPIAAFEGLSRRDPSWTHLGSLANMRIDQGRYDDASRGFAAAPIGYTDTHPLPLAWIDVQHGVMHLRLGDAATANLLFRAAYERFPEYVLAAEHLAETEALLGRLDESVAIYEAVIAQSDNPEFAHALAGVEAERGNFERAAALEREARARYEVLLAEHPLAYAAHAASFYLDVGEPERALELARLDVEARRPVGSLLLWAETALAADRLDEACEALAEAEATGLRPPERDALAPAIEACAY